VQQNIENKIMDFFQQLISDKNHRYKSWEHCFEYFAKDKKDISEDIASLHLSFYLASWGMYRGSSFLLQKDYKYHFKTVKTILEYKDLQKINFSKIDKNSKDFKEIFDLSKKLKECYPNNNVTDTLLTKILLGTLGCVPAYDRFFKAGLKDKESKPYSNFSENSFESVIKFYQNNQVEFDEVQKEINYPIMKLIDMYFFKIGVASSDKNS
jgi:hypothetical protein